MSYLTRIDELRRAELQLRAAQFAATYDPNLPSVILLPGGMGSRLLRSRTPYDPVATSGTVEFYELWLGLGPLLLGELTCLTMNDRTEELAYYFVGSLPGAILSTASVSCPQTCHVVESRERAYFTTYVKRRIDLLWHQPVKGTLPTI